MTHARNAIPSLAATSLVTAIALLLTLTLNS